MILDTNLKLEAVLAGAVATSQPEYHVFFKVWNLQGQQSKPATSRGALNNATDVTILAAPTTIGEVREVTSAFIYNKDTAAVTVTVKTDDGTTERILAKKAIGAGESLQFSQANNWFIAAVV